MTKIVLSVFLLCFGLAALGQTNPGAVYLSNGEVREGLVRYDWPEKKVSYKADKEVKRERIPLTAIDSFRVKVFDTVVTLHVKYIAAYDKNYVLAKKTDGPITLFFNPIVTQTNIGGPASSNIFASTGPIIYSKSINYFLEKNTGAPFKRVIPYLDIRRRFKQMAPIYFEECPALVEKIEQKEYRKFDIVAMVDFYNKNCVTN